MRKVTKLVAVLIAVSASTAMATVVLDFNCVDKVTRRTAGSGTTITLDFTVDGSGAVTLDASTTSLLLEVINSCDSWDGIVGTVDDASLNGTSFQLVVSSWADNTANRSFVMDGRYTSAGILGVSGNNASRIDGQTATLPNDMEYLKFTLTSGSPLISLQSFNWDMAGGSAGFLDVADARLIDGDSDVLHYDMVRSGNVLSCYGTTDTSADGLTIGSDTGALIFTSPRGDAVPPGDFGYGVAGMTLNVIPEPGTIGMLGLGAIATLLVRRFKKHVESLYNK